MSNEYRWAVLGALAAFIRERQSVYWLRWRFEAEHPDLYGPHPTA